MIKGGKMVKPRWIQKIINGLVFSLIWILRGAVSLRYRLEVKGLENLIAQGLHQKGGILFLPNHPAELDPVFLELLLWKKFSLRPLVVEHFYYLKGFRVFLDLVGALPLPMIDRRVNKWRAKKIREQFNQIAEALKQGGNFLIYPSGRLKLTGSEVIGGASFVHDLLQQVPETPVVLVRTTGLWGSQFSKALTGASPDFGTTLWKGCKILLKNGIFFAPRRKVLIEMELASKDLPSQGPRLAFNQYLEEWYNYYPQKGAEPLSLVSYAFWKKEFPKVSIDSIEKPTLEEKPIPENVQTQVLEHLSKMSGLSCDKIQRKMHLSQELGLDSLDIAQLYVFLDEKFSVHDLTLGSLTFVEDVLQIAAGYHKEEQGSHTESQAKRKWPKEKKRLNPQLPDGKTIQEVFLKSMDRQPGAVACTDLLSSSLSYRKCKMVALLLAKEFEEIEGSSIGILLPSSVTAYLVIMAVLLANKTPVMLNWTTGIRALDHAVDLTGLKTVLTSSKFLDRLEDGELGKLENGIVFLEDLRKKIGLKKKLNAFFLSLLNSQVLLKRKGLKELDPSSPAVILFTSGTESLPKGVPLSHTNLLSNQRACLQKVSFFGEDILYGVLPPFHSFGFSITGIFPLLTGIKACYSPDPTDSHGMVKDIAGWKPTLFCAAPSFIRAVFRVASAEELQSLRLVVAGAEKTPQELFDFVKTSLPSARLLEGYGITECSPVVTLDPFEGPHRGVGQPLSNVELAVIDPTTGQLLEKGREGEICIAAPSVFSGYLGHPRDPFITIEERKWYLSGDWGYVDEEGFLILLGRLKRFVKIGGEMVSLSGLEEELSRIGQERGWFANQTETKEGQSGPSLAVSVKEKETDKPALVLFTTFNIAKEEVNSALKGCGYGRIVKIAEVHCLKEIPLTGTGKTHYRLLDEMCKS